MRSLQIYAPKARQAEFQQAIDRARDWLVTAKPESTEERAFRLLGLFWAKGPQATIDEAARELIADQRPDGGWSQTPTLTSDAYATGQAIAALRESGVLKADDPVYVRAAQYLLNTQYEDGSWYVKNRANPVQAPFESGFPHGRDQWISAAATSWATEALALSR
jgi:N-acyl-D-amino-acid deacylase